MLCSFLFHEVSRILSNLLCFFLRRSVDIKVIFAIGDYISIQIHACIGGNNMGEDIRKHEHGVQVVSGTLGRVCDII